MIAESGDGTGVGEGYFDRVVLEWVVIVEAKI